MFDTLESSKIYAYVKFKSNIGPYYLIYFLFCHLPYKNMNMSTNEYLIIILTGRSAAFLKYMMKSRSAIDALLRIKVLIVQ